MIADRSLVALIPALALLAAAPADTPTLEQAEAEADRLDSGWRLADLLARRPKLPPDKDGGARVLEVFRAMPKEWKDLGGGAKGPGTPEGAFEALTTAIGDDPSRPVTPEVVSALKTQQAKITPLLAKARDLEKYATGRYEVTFGLNPLEAKIPHIQDARSVARLLQFDTLARAAAGDIDGALGSARAILAVARSIGDEPMAISQLVRMAIEGVAVEVIGQVLARGQASDAALASTQAALADEAAQPLLLIAARGERATNYALWTGLSNGSIDDAGFKGSPAILIGDRATFYRESQAASLAMLTRAVEIAKRPTPEQATAWEVWARDLDIKKQDIQDPKRSMPFLFLPPLGPVSQAYLRTRAILRAAETMVGLERVRRAEGRWPRPGESLAPAFKDAAPTDPFTGKPILWKATPGAIVVYSAGYDRGDHGGKLENRNVKTPGTDIGFRLPDAERRPKAARAR